MDPGRRASLTLLILSCCCQSAVLTPNFRIELPLRQFERVRDAVLSLVGRTADSPRLLQRAAKLHKFQPPVGPETAFPCDVVVGRSPRRPQSVHRLRPGDIDVVAALGDSLTAGNGAAASNLLHVYTENRGISWSIGGQGSWREYLTLPNMLKEFNPRLVGYSLGDSLSHHRASQFNVGEEFNPRLVGYSLGDSLSHHRASQFNVGEIGANSGHLPFMARELVKRIRNDPRVDVDKDWKLITLMMGSNDFCLDICYEDTRTAPERHRQDLVHTLDYLKKNLPRTLVQIVISPNLGLILKKFKAVKPQCRLTRLIECPCLFGLPNQHRQAEFLELMKLWQQAEFKVAADPRYLETDDFAVVAQTFTYNVTFPTRVDDWGAEVTDFTYMSEDCFHFSQKGYSRAVTALWNNMFEPVGRKSTNWRREFSHFECPSEASPFIYTNRNS